MQNVLRCNDMSALEIDTTTANKSSKCLLDFVCTWDSLKNNKNPLLPLESHHLPLTTI